MQLFTEKRPHLRSKDTSNIIMSDVLIAMSFLVILSFLYFGRKSIMLILSSVCTCYILDTIFKSFKNRNFQLSDVSSIVTGVIISLIMPATVPIYVPITASIIAVTIAKHCFGGLGQNVFNPAATGISFVALCWPKLMFIYPIPSTTNLTETFSENVSYTLKLGGRPTVEIFDMILGKQPGPIGTTHILVICSCIMWLVMRKAVYFPSILSFAGVCAVVSFIFPRIYSERLLSVVYELSSGSLLFGGVFMMTDPVTSPKFKPAKVVYGGMIGLLAMIFRYFGSFDQGIYFAILLGNASSFSIDKVIYKNQDFINNLSTSFRKLFKNSNRPVMLYEEVKRIENQGVK